MSRFHPALLPDLPPEMYQTMGTPNVGPHLSPPPSGLMPPSHFASPLHIGNQGNLPFADLNRPMYDMHGTPLNFPVPGLHHQPQHSPQNPMSFHHHTIQGPPTPNFAPPPHNLLVPHEDFDRMLRERDSMVKERDSTVSSLHKQLRHLESIREESLTRSNGEVESLKEAARRHIQQMQEHVTLKRESDLRLQESTRHLEKIMSDMAAHNGRFTKLEDFHQSKMIELSDLQRRHNALSAEHEDAKQKLTLAEKLVSQHSDQIQKYQGEYRQLNESHIKEKRQMQQQYLQHQQAKCDTLQQIISTQKLLIEDHEAAMRKVLAELNAVKGKLEQSNMTKDKLISELAAAKRLNMLHIYSKPQPTGGGVSESIQSLDSAKGMKFYEMYQKYLLEQQRHTDLSSDQQRKNAEKMTLFYMENFFDKKTQNPVLPQSLAAVSKEHLRVAKASQDEQIANDEILAKRIYSDEQKVLQAYAVAQENVRARVGRGPVVLPLRKTAVSPPSPPTESVERYNQKRKGVFEKQYKFRLGYLQSIFSSGDHKKLAEQYASDFINKWFYVNNPRPEDIKNHGLPEATRLANAQASALPWLYGAISKI